MATAKNRPIDRRFFAAHVTHFLTFSEFTQLQ